MHEALEQLLGEVEGGLGLAILGLVIVEWVVSALIGKVRSHKEGVVNILSYVLESLPYLFLDRFLVFGVMAWSYAHRVFTLGTAWYVWIAAYLAYDLTFYAVHVLGHKVRFFWCIHGVHHTLEEMKLTAAVRGSFIGVIYNTHAVIWLPLLGFDPILLFVVEAFARFYGLYEHVSEAFIGKQPWLEKVFVTPSVHRVHHASNELYLDRNYGETFSFWDRVFGTFQTQLDHEPPAYGLRGKRVDSESLWQVQTALWRELWRDIAHAERWSDRLGYLLMAPGWTPRAGPERPRHAAFTPSDAGTTTPPSPG
jgi:sterol desaturase/sphingolipid hydroxylase (fatty acid hydroxylase superfamily)